MIDRRALTACALVSTLVLAASCAAPLRVRQVSATRFYVEQSQSALSSRDVSEHTRTVLRRHDLLNRYEADPDGTAAALREHRIAGFAGREELFALAEISLFHAQRDDSAPHYLASALYAYAYLFPDDARAAPDPLDPRTRMACDMYNRALAKALGNATDDYVTPRSGTFALPFGELQIQFDERDLVWHRYRLVELSPMGELEVRGIRNRYRTAGIGVPLAARPAPIDGSYEADDLIGPHARVPVTAVLRLDRPERQLARQSLQGTLEVHATVEQQAITIDGRTVPLEAERTAVLASSLAASRVWKTELGAFVGKTIALKPQPNLLRGLQPYARGKVPVVFVHGTASSPFRWADLVNDLLHDPLIRDRAQFWFFTYDSGNPIAYSSYGLRTLLAARVREFAGDVPDRALERMVIIGHSQGGLLAKMTAIHSGDRFWRHVSRKPFADARLSSGTRALLQDALFVEPLPFVKRLIFVCTPHQGSFLASRQLVRRLMRRLISMPSNIVGLGSELATLSAAEGTILRMPTSIDNMDPRNQFIRTLAAIPIDPAVAAHSIIAVEGEGDPADGDDGVVAYRSAHISGVESELVVRSSHSAQANPKTVAEVRRILREHLAAPADGATVAAGRVSPDGRWISGAGRGSAAR
jgi:pimeloyl-ACP methyl ester carboxylesterase